MKRLLSTSLLAILAAPLAAVAQTGSVTARLVAFDGSLDVIRQGIPLALFPDMPLSSGDLVHTRDGRATLRFDDGSEIRLRPTTRIQVSDRGPARDIDVLFGRLWALVTRAKERPTAFRTGQTIASVRGTELEYAAQPDGGVAVGVKDGEVEVTTRLADGSTASVRLLSGQQTLVPPGGGPLAPAPFAPGAIADAVRLPGVPPGPGATAPVAPQPAAPLPVVPPPSPAVPPAPAPAVPAPVPAPATPTAPAAVEDEDSGIETQGEYAVKLINALGITSALPPDATDQDATNFLARLGILPCEGVWERDREITLRDLLCIAGIDPDDPNAPLTIALEEMIERILEKYGELFWIQTRRQLTVSPFAP